MFNLDKFCKQYSSWIPRDCEPDEVYYTLTHMLTPYVLKHVDKSYLKAIQEAVRTSKKRNSLILAGLCVRASDAYWKDDATYKRDQWTYFLYAMWLLYTENSLMLSLSNDDNAILALTKELNKFSSVSDAADFLLKNCYKVDNSGIAKSGVDKINKSKSIEEDIREFAAENNVPTLKVVCDALDTATENLKGRNSYETLHNVWPYYVSAFNRSK